MFKDRKDAGQKLAELLLRFKGEDAVVYALPRGGVALGAEISKKLKIPLDLVITRKIGHPHDPEYAICAISESGETICNEQESFAVDQEWLKKEEEKERKEAERRRKVYLKDKPSISPKDKIAIIVDDGIATGITMRLAIKTLKAQGPKKIVVAVPILPKEVLSVLKKEADEVIFIEGAEGYLGSVGAYYEEFHQLEDKEVISLLDN